MTLTPICFFEHKYLYRSQTNQVPNDYYTIPIGKATVRRFGKDITLVTYGMGVHWAEELADEMETTLEIIDLRTLLPWDKEAVKKSVKKTGKILILHEDCLTGGIGSEIAAWVSEYCFEYLDAPIMRTAGLDTPVPFAKILEEDFLPKKRLKEKIVELLKY